MRACDIGQAVQTREVEDRMREYQKDPASGQIAERVSRSQGRTTSRRRRQKGGALVEAALVSSFLYVPLLIGLAVIGISTINRLQLDQLVRDVGIMHARGMDFSTAKGYQLFIMLTKGSPFQVDTTPPTYNGTVIISTIRMVSSADCNRCSNVGQPVVTFRTVLGNPTLYGSRFGTPSTVGNDGRVPNWTSDASARATGFTTVLNGMQAGDEAFVAEGYMRTPSIAFPEVNARAEVTSWAIF